MVLNSVSQTETPPTPPPPRSPQSPMAPSTINTPKSHPPLHNFPLHSLRWSMTMNHFRTYEPIRPLSPSHQNSPLNNKPAGSGSSLLPVLRLGLPPPPNPTENKNNSSDSGDSGPDQPVGDAGVEVKKGGSTVKKPVEPVEKEKKKGKVKGQDGKSKIHNRLQGRKNKGSSDGNGDGDAPADAAGEKDRDGDGDGDGDEAEDDAEFSCEENEPIYNFVKTWNLRPRKAVTKPTNQNNVGGGSRNGGAASQQNKPRPRVRAAPPEAKEKEKEKEKAVAAASAVAQQKSPVFSLSLTKEEIEEDFLRMTGAKPPKKAKKRPRAMQKQLDVTFPGLWLTNVNPELYKVPDPPLKG